MARLETRSKVSGGNQIEMLTARSSKTPHGLVSRIPATERLTIRSKIAAIRCPACNALQPQGRLRRTLSGAKNQKFWAHQCRDCAKLLKLSEPKWPVDVWVKFPLRIFAMACLITWCFFLAQHPALGHIHPTRGTLEPNLAGFFVASATFFFVTLFVEPVLLRFYAAQSVEVEK